MGEERCGCAGECKSRVQAMFCFVPEWTTVRAIEGGFEKREGEAFTMLGLWVIVGNRQEGIVSDSHLISLLFGVTQWNVSMKVDSLTCIPCLPILNAHRRRRLELITEPGPMRADTSEPTKESGAPEYRETSGWRFFHALGPLPSASTRKG